jgi:FKBP-type peptidyl-prolyl cis-trans isomerase FkpA
MRKFLIPALGAFCLALAACKKEVKTEHGYRFTNHTNKSGDKAKPGEVIKFDMVVFIGDSMMTSTYQQGQPLDFRLFEKEEVPARVPAVYDAALLMAEGDSATIFQPIDSAMLQFIPDALKKEKELRFEMKLVDIMSKEQVEAKMAEEQKKMEDEQKAMEEEMKNADATKTRGTKEVAPLVQKTLSDYKAGKLGGKLQKTASGLEYVILEKGSGDAVKMGDRVPTHYYGALKSDGKMFDNSFDRGMSAPFSVGQLVPGFNEGMQLLNRGGKAIIFIPSALGYGPQGAGDRIPPDSDLVFYIELK